MHFDQALFRDLYGGTGFWLWTMAALTVIGSGWTMLPIAALVAFERTRATRFVSSRSSPASERSCSC